MSIAPLRVACGGEASGARITPCGPPPGALGHRACCPSGANAVAGTHAGEEVAKDALHDARRRRRPQRRDARVRASGRSGRGAVSDAACRVAPLSSANAVDAEGGRWRPGAREMWARSGLLREGHRLQPRAAVAGLYPFGTLEPAEAGHRRGAARAMGRKGNRAMKVAAEAIALPRGPAEFMDVRSFGASGRIVAMGSC